MVQPLTIDCHYLRPQIAAAYLIRENQSALFVENNTAHAVPRLLEALKQTGLKPEQVEYLIITHVHLDHAGGTSVLMKACPNAKLLAHPRAAPHMIDPSKLVRSARQVYGDAAFEKLYGEIGPVDPSRVRVMQDGEELPFGNRVLKFIHTRGHANHHFCIFDGGTSGSQGIFTGDSFGLAYPALQKKGLFIYPSTSPTDYNPEEAKKSIDKILQSGAKKAYLTHFGEIQELEAASRQLKDHLDFYESLLAKATQSTAFTKSTNSNTEVVQFFESQIEKYFQSLCAQQGLEITSEVWEIIQLDLHLNAAGIAHLAQKLRQT